MKSFKSLLKLLMLLSLAVSVFVSCSEEDEVSPDTGVDFADLVDTVLEGTYTTDVTIAADTKVLLRGTVLFDSGATLTISNGVTLYGDPTVFSYLIIDQGADIIANGTESSPITFTSILDAGSRSQQDWGGIIINGYAVINSGDTAEGEGDSGEYGGTDDADNSGSLTYVRVMFAGKDFNSENELNGLALQGVGSGTVLSNLQFHNNKDDGIEFFGGKVDAHYIISTGNGDDQIDATEGWRGTVNYAIAAAIVGDKGLEIDNNGSDNLAIPQTYAQWNNVTVVAGDRDAARLREGSSNIIVDSIFASTTGGTKQAIDVDSTNSYASISDSIYDGFGTSAEEVIAEAFAGTAVVEANITTNTSLTLFTAGDFADLASLELVGAAAFTPSSPQTVGAVVNGVNPFTAWTTFPAN